MIDRSSVLRYLRERAQRPVRLKEIARGLDVEARDYRLLKRLLRDMEEAGEIYRVRRRRYALPGRINLVVGRMQVTRAGHGFVLPEEGGEDVFVRSAQLGSAYDGDRVVARIERRRRGRNPEGTVVKVLERARSRVVGVYRASGRFGLLAPIDQALHRDVFVPPGADSGAPDGWIVVARIVDWGSDHNDPVGEVVEILGRPGDPGVDVLAIVHAHELPAEFPHDVLSEADELAARSRRAAELEGRADFRDLLTFTIDPIDAKDHDDALSIQQLALDRWRVGVHIADVSHFVGEGSRIDLEAFDRGTSVYLVDRVLPMLPEVLSSDLCSLKPGADRLTLSACLDLKSTGELISVDFTSSVIRSRYALTYEEAQEIVDGERGADEELREALERLRGLALRLRERRQARGGLDFDLPEARVIVNAAGEPTAVQRILRLDTHRLIEEFMILVNESVARAAEARQLPFIYRVHEAPDPDRLERLREFVAGLGLKLEPDADRSPRALQRLLASVEGRPEDPVVSTLVLRSMKQARYSAERSGHFGLGSRAYTHFTSPIRRYPDLAVHRIVRSALLERCPVAEGLEAQLEAVARRASARERQAMEAERESVELKKMEFLERHLGDVFHGTISGVMSFGLFVLLDDVLAEGLVHVGQLGDDYYHFVEAEYALVGEVRRRRFRLGGRVQVQVIRVNREARELDLGLYD
ncbi:MAG: ribonuclease R [Gemmatimonadota bacterium]|nr:MAG: ribonuclease R [Gemmatimonadota bacterium]